MGSTCFQSSSNDPQKLLNKKKTTINPNIKNNQNNNEDNKSISKLSETKKEAEKRRREEALNLNDPFFLKFKNPLVRIHTNIKEIKKIDDLYQTLNLISTEEKNK